jgi:hypothetical protein
VHARSRCQRIKPRILHFVSQKLHIYEVRPRKDKRGVNLISDALPFGGLWYAEPSLNQLSG